jgi:hypothetical protein
MLRRYVTVPLVLAGVLAVAVAFKDSFPGGWKERDEPRTLKFSHKLHIKDVGVDCADCHPGGKTSTLASDNLRAGHDNCTSCHEQQLSDSCGMCHVNPDNPVALLPQERTVRFAHEQHVSGHAMECATCHAGLGETDYAGPANMPPMETCNSCHNDAKVTNACEACHTSFVNLIPPDHLVADFKKEHKKRTRLGALDVECQTCHTQDFCSQCHNAPSLIQFGRGAKTSEPLPRVSPSNSPKQMTIEMVHSLNYRFTHGIDAKSKSSDCYTCHSAKEFCTDCHAAGDNISALAFKPAWHLGVNFTTIGRGSGGGRHADYARRDLETCVACHDAQGGDPTCVRCHFDGDGVKGTDPKTHPASFTQDRGDGSWHADRGATCYNCHTDFNAHPGGEPGKGFCGYCHGRR